MGRILTAKYAKYANKMRDNPILFAYFAYFAVENPFVGGVRVQPRLVPPMKFPH